MTGLYVKEALLMPGGFVVGALVGHQIFPDGFAWLWGGLAGGVVGYVVAGDPPRNQR